MSIPNIIISALQIIASAAPGFLAAFSGHASDEDAIAHAEKAVLSIPQHPAGTSIAAWRKHLEDAKKP
jgi:hypothetical protein